MYLEGLGVEKDYAQALYYYTLAAEQGHGGGNMGLGSIYQLGQGVKQSDAEAVRYYQLAAN